jgi:hypothetical protein
LKKKIPYAASPLYLFGETVVKVGRLIKNDKERKIVQKMRQLSWSDILPEMIREKEKKVKKYFILFYKLP